ncbi:MAG TPA: hypothetical protein PLB81_03180 [Deltaproteobacteria bacterium]|nr:hypothetical protein [Deltaproteobacteria bacterium]
MDIKKAFEEGRFLDIVGSADFLTSYEERLILGQSLMKLGRDSEALTVFQGMYREIEHRIKSLYYIAQIHQRSGDEESARFYLARYLAFRPDDDEAADLMEAVQETPMMMEPSLELARLYGRQGHFSQALDIYGGLLMTSMDPEVRDEALKVQNLSIIKTLEGWLERLKSGRSDTPL